MSDPMDSSRKIAEALEKLVAKQVTDFELSMNVLSLPNDIRAPMWKALCRRAMAKMIECEGESP